MADTHGHHAEKEEKKDEKKPVKKEIHKQTEPAHAHEAHAPKGTEPAHTHEANAPKGTEPAHTHEANAHDHTHDGHEHGHEHKHDSSAHAHKAVAPIKKVAQASKPQAAKAPVKEAAPSKAADIADEIEKELETGKVQAGEGAKVEGGKDSSEPELEIVDDEAATPKEGAEEGAKESAGAGAEENAAQEKKKEKKGGKLIGKKKKKKQYRAQPKPELTEEIRRAMKLRLVLKDKTPNFIRQDSYNYRRLGEVWRKPRGKHSKLRHHISYRINVVSIGYGGPKAARGLHPSGFREVLVHHPLELDGVDPKTEAARVAHGVGFRKREMIQRRAERMGIRILNEVDTS